MYRTSCACMRAHTYPPTRVQAHTRVHTHTHVRAHVHAHTRAHMHTHTHASWHVLTDSLLPSHPQGLPVKQSRLLSPPAFTSLPAKFKVGPDLPRPTMSHGSQPQPSPGCPGPGKTSWQLRLSREQAQQGRPGATSPAQREAIVLSPVTALSTGLALSGQTCGPSPSTSPAAILGSAFLAPAHGPS